MLNRITRISLSALALLAAFTLGMLFTQRATLTPARAEVENPVVKVIPITTEQITERTDKVTTRVTRVLIVYANGTVSIPGF